MAHTYPWRINDIHTFGFATSELEPIFLLQTSLAHGIRHNHILTSPSSGSSNQQRGWQAIGYSAEHGNSVFRIPFSSLAATLGVASLRSGHGGDEIVTNTGGLALQELIGQRRWGQAPRDVPGPVVLRPAPLAKRIRRRTGDVSHLTAPMMRRLAYTPLRADVFAECRIAQRTFEAARYDALHS